MSSAKPLWGVLTGHFIRPSWAPLILLFTLLAILLVQFSTRPVFSEWLIYGRSTAPGDVADGPRTCAGFFGAVPTRKVVMSITEFGGVGDGKTSNTETFRRAVGHMQGFGEKGGSQLNVPRGRWLTGSFNLTSNFTLFLEEGAVILGSQARMNKP
jgi:hypothetical protein